MLSIRLPNLRAGAARPVATGWPIAVPVAFVLVPFFLLRLTYLHSVEPDEADQILFGQQLAWGYSEQSPLYCWISTAAFELLGTSAAALMAVRTAILAAVMVALYRTAVAMIPDRRLALLATYSVVLLPSHVWHSLTYLTHTILLFLACVLCLFFCLRIVRDGRTRDYVFLGIVCAAGVLSKYNFALFALAILFAGLTIAPARRRLLDLRLGLTALAFAALVAPHALWIFEHRAIILDETLVKMTHTRNRDYGHAMRSLIGLKDLFQNSLLSIGPVLIAFGWSFRTAYAPSILGNAEDFPSIARRLLGRFFVFAYAMMAGMIVNGGWDRFHERWLLPFVFLVPLWLFAGVNPLAIQGYQLKRYAATLIAMAIALTTARAVQVTVFLDGTKGLYPLRLDFSDVARAIEAEAGSRPLILTKQREVGGNLKLALPGARVLCCYGNLHDLPPTDGPIVIAWNPVMSDNKPDVPWPWLKKFWPIAAPRPVPWDSVTIVPVAASGYGGRPASVAFVVLK